MWAEKALTCLKGMLDKGASVLDIGCGAGEHARLLKHWGFDVKTIDLKNGADYTGYYCDVPFGSNRFDAIWASHVLEHQRNVGFFLDKCRNELVDDGVLAITVPPLKSNLVGGHLTLWTPGHLAYNLVLAGFDCSESHLFQDGYNISALVRKKQISLPDLAMDSGDVRRLKDFFPAGVKEGMDAWKVEQQ